MMKQLFIMLASLAFIACSNNDQRSETTQTVTIEPWYSNCVVRHFSDESHKDTLQITVNGETLLTGQVYFKIKAHTGNIIFWDNFPATALIGHQGLIDPVMDEKYVKKRLGSFFDSEHFGTSSRLIADRLTLADSTKRAWKRIQSDPGSIYFTYQSNKNGLSEIAYSKSLKKVFSVKDQQALQ